MKTSTGGTFPSHLLLVWHFIRALPCSVLTVLLLFAVLCCYSSFCLLVGSLVGSIIFRDQFWGGTSYVPARCWWIRLYFCVLPKLIGTTVQLRYWDLCLTVDTTWSCPSWSVLVSERSVEVLHSRVGLRVLFKGSIWDVQSYAEQVVKCGNYWSVVGRCVLLGRSALGLKEDVAGLSLIWLHVR